MNRIGDFFTSPRCRYTLHVFTHSTAHRSSYASRRSFSESSFAEPSRRLAIARKSGMNGSTSATSQPDQSIVPISELRDLIMKAVQSYQFSVQEAQIITEVRHALYTVCIVQILRTHMIWHLHKSRGKLIHHRQAG